MNALQTFALDLIAKKVEIVNDSPIRLRYVPKLHEGPDQK